MLTIMGRERRRRMKDINYNGERKAKEDKRC